VREIEAAMQLDGDALEPGSRILFDYFYQRRDITRGQPFFDNLERIAKQRRQAEAARLAIADSFLPYELDAASVQGFAEACASGSHTTMTKSSVSGNVANPPMLARGSPQ